MPYSEMLATRIRKYLEGRPNVTEMKMFGGVAFMLYGNMACGIVADDLMVRVGPQAYDAALNRPGVRKMDFTGKPMKGYIFVSGVGYSSSKSLHSWIDAGMTFCMTLPRKQKK